MRLFVFGVMFKDKMLCYCVTVMSIHELCTGVRISRYGKKFQCRKIFQGRLETVFRRREPGLR